MAAGVHLSGHKGLIFKTGIFLDGQGVHVGSEHKGFPRMGAFEDSNDAGGFHLLGDLDAQPAQFIGYYPGSAVLLVAKLGMHVEVTAQLDDPGKESIT
jgi:hypothetical protein